MFCLSRDVANLDCSRWGIVTRSRLQMVAFSAMFVLILLAVTALGVGRWVDGRFFSSLMFAAIMFELAVRVPRPPKLPVHLAYCVSPEARYIALYCTSLLVMVSYYTAIPHECWCDGFAACMLARAIAHQRHLLCAITSA